MKVGLETAIRDLLITHNDLQIVASELGQRLCSGQCSKKERFAFFEFLIEAGAQNEAFNCVQYFLQNDIAFDWSLFFDLLRRTKFKPKPEFIEKFFAALDEAKTEFVYFAPWENINPKFKKINSEHLRSQLSEAKAKEDSLFEKLNYFSANRMTAEQGTLLNELIRRFPESTELANKKQEFDENWAQAYVAEKAREYRNRNLYALDFVPTPDKSSFAFFISNFIKETSVARPQLAYSFAIGLFFMELFQAALDALANAPEGKNTDWFRLELLLKSRRLIECLEGIGELEIKYAEDPESSFATTYLRALVLKELGQDRPAVQLLQSITNVRPNYRSASALLYAWEGRAQ